MSPTLFLSGISPIARRALTADLVSTAAFPIAITGSTSVVPYISHEFGAPEGLAVWVVLGYNTTFAAALLAAGRFADRTHRARFFALGNLVVATAGIASALAPSAASLVALRTAAGLGAAMCAAGGSSMVLAAFPPAQRLRVYRYSGMVLGLSLAVGPLVSHMIVSTLGWRVVFAAPAVLALVASLASFRLPDWPRDTQSLDTSGVGMFAGLVTAGCVALGLVGTAPPIALVLAAGLTVTAGVAFARREMRADSPVLPLDLLAIPEFRWYASASGAFMGCLVSALALFPLSSVAQTAPGLVAACLVPVTGAPAIMPLLVAPLTRRDPRNVVRLALGGCLVASLLTALTSVTSTFNAVTLVGAAACLGVSLGVSQGVPDGQALSEVPATHGGAGAALFSTTRMTIETLVLAATSGVTTAMGAAAGALVSGSVCALVLITSPSVSDGAPSLGPDDT